MESLDLVRKQSVKMVEIEVEEETNRVGIILRLGEWEKKDINMDRFIDLKGDVTEVWIVQSIEEIFYSKNDVNIKHRIKGAYLDSKRDIVKIRKYLIIPSYI